jgi:predicted alpha/beta hydrolase family esterase
MNTIIIHGMPDKEEYESTSSYQASKQHWIPWLVEAVAQKGETVTAPEMPHPYDPSYDAWVRVFETCPVTETTTLIGHSGGAGFLVRWLSEHPVSCNSLILVAPWIDPDHELKGAFFDFIIDPTLSERIASIVVLYGDNDMESVLKTVDELKAALPKVLFVALPGKGHCTTEDMGTNEFVEILPFITSS